MVARNSINLILLIILSQTFTESPPQQYANESEEWSSQQKWEKWIISYTSHQYANGGSEEESILGWKLQNHIKLTLGLSVYSRVASRNMQGNKSKWRASSDQEVLAEYH